MFHVKAEEITLTIGQAFDLAYRKFLESGGKDVETRKQIAGLQKRVSSEVCLFGVFLRDKRISTVFVLPALYDSTISSVTLRLLSIATRKRKLEKALVTVKHSFMFCHLQGH